MTTLADRASSREGNNLNAIRLALALGVVVSHAFPTTLGPGGELHGEPLVAATHGQESLGSVAVNLFFFISGMLITASWLRSASMQDFLLRRVLRIYPGYIAAVIASGVLIWALCPEFRADVGHGAAWASQWVQDGLFLTRASLEEPGIFARNPFPGEANGSLWTIQKEFGCYILVMVIGLFCLFKRRRLLLVVSTLVFLRYAWLLHPGRPEIGGDLRFLVYYLVGMMAWLWRDRIVLSGTLFAACAAVLSVGSQFQPWFALLFPLAGCYVVLGLGYGPVWRRLRWTETTDLSYGVYLYAFPVQQVVAMAGALRAPWLSLAVSVPATCGAAWLSWHFVEKRFLRFKSRHFTDFDPASRALARAPVVGADT